jgi:hypothetical protein
VFALVSLSACAPALLQNPPTGGDSQQVSGLRYWLPVDVAVIEANVSTVTTRDIAVGREKDKDKPVLFVETTEEVEREGTLSLRTVADETVAPHTLDIKTGRLRDTSLGIEVSSTGLLRSVSPSSTGRAGDVIQAVAEFAGTALSLGTGLPFTRMNLPNKWIFMEKAGPLKLALACDPFEAPFTTLPLRVRAFSSESEEGCGLLLEIMQREAALKRHEQQRMDLELKLETTSEGELPKLRERIQAVKGAIKSTQSELAGRQARFAALLEAWVADKKLGVKTDKKDFATVLQLTEVPPDASSLDRYAKAKTFFDETGILITSMVLADAAKTPVIPGMKGKDTVRIFYRQSVPRRFRVEASTETEPDPAKRKLLSETIADVVLPASPPQYVDFESSAFADRKLTLAFDDRGRPLRLERTGTSAGAAVAVAVSDATRAVRDEYASGLTKMAEIQATQQKLQMATITSQLDELKKKKEILDARLALEGGEQNFQTLLEQQQLQAEIALLQARQTQASTTETAAQRADIEALKLQLEQVKTELEILKAKQEIEKLNTKK